MSNIIPFNELEAMASYIARSKLFGAKDESQAMSLMLVAQAEGCHPMTAVQDFDIVQGRPARKTHSILARFQAAGGSVAWEEISPTRAVGTFTHKQGGSLRVEWTFEQARKAGLTNKDNWKNYPQAMLRARCIAEGVRAVFPGAIGGMLTVEEAHDIAGEIDITPQRQPARQGAAAVAEQALAVEFTEAHEKLLADLEAVADNGMAALETMWSAITKEQRRALAEHLPVLKKRAEKVIEPEVGNA